MVRIEGVIIRLCLEPHMCKRQLCTFWDPKRLTGLSYKVLVMYNTAKSCKAKTVVVLYYLFLMYLIDIMAKSFRLTMYFVCRFSHYVLRNRMPFVCYEYVEQCSFVWTASRLCTCTIGYLTLLPLWTVRPVQSLSACTRVHFTFLLYILCWMQWTEIIPDMYQVSHICVSVYSLTL